MTNYQDLFIFTGAFALIALASKQMGQFFVKAKLPLISGFLFAGIVAGPFALGLISTEATQNLRFVDEFSLAFIAFAAGSELYLKELRSRFRSITWVTAGLVVATFSLGSLALFLLADFIPFMQLMSPLRRVAVSILAGAILVARSPSSAIAIINELRASGRFTQTALGVTVIMDVVVIVLFALNSSVADAILTSLGIDLKFMILLLGELLASLAFGYAIGKILQFILAYSINRVVKTGLILLTGYGVFVLSENMRHFTHNLLSFEIFLEPLLICMVSSFLVANYSPYRAEFLKILQESGPLIYIAFFTLTGASLELNILAQTWPIALALFAVRLGAIFIGSFSGGTLARDPIRYNRIAWMAYVTQAGVGLGLAKEVAVEFPEWGAAFATVIISVIVLNQIVGPPLFKSAINLVRESHLPAKTQEFDGVRDAIIFGLEGQSLALARQLRTHDWQVKIAAREASYMEKMVDSDISIYPISNLGLQTLRELGVDKTEAIVTLLSDEENYLICELANEYFGIENLVVRLNDRANFDRFHQIGVLIVEPTTAIVSLLDHLVRSPSAASLLLGLEDGQDIIDLEVCNPNLHGVALRNLRLPLDTLILSVHRGNRLLISHGYTRLKIGDRVTIVGSLKSLDEVMLHFDPW
jgi:Trk K+ transport system NAD-binding subunit/Kef-type K+ transport system membrane component KefB